MKIQLVAPLALVLCSMMAVAVNASTAPEFFDLSVSKSGLFITASREGKLYWFDRHSQSWGLYSETGNMSKKKDVAVDDYGNHYAVDEQGKVIREAPSYSYGTRSSIVWEDTLIDGYATNAQFVKVATQKEGLNLHTTGRDYVMSLIALSTSGHVYYYHKTSGWRPLTNPSGTTSIIDISINPDGSKVAALDSAGQVFIQPFHLSDGFGGVGAAGEPDGGWYLHPSGANSGMVEKPRQVAFGPDNNEDLYFVLENDDVWWYRYGFFNKGEQQLWKVAPEDGAVVYGISTDGFGFIECETNMQVHLCNNLASPPTPAPTVPVPTAAPTTMSPTPKPTRAPVNTPPPVLDHIELDESNGNMIVTYQGEVYKKVNSQWVQITGNLLKKTHVVVDQYGKLYGVNEEGKAIMESRPTSSPVTIWEDTLAVGDAANVKFAKVETRWNGHGDPIHYQNVNHAIILAGLSTTGQFFYYHRTSGWRKLFNPPTVSAFSDIGINGDATMMAGVSENGDLFLHKFHSNGPTGVWVAVSGPATAGPAVQVRLTNEIYLVDGYRDVYSAAYDANTAGFAYGGWNKLPQKLLSISPPGYGVAEDGFTIMSCSIGLVSCSQIAGPVEGPPATVAPGARVISIPAGIRLTVSNNGKYVAAVINNELFTLNGILHDLNWKKPTVAGTARSGNLLQVVSDDGGKLYGVNQEGHIVKNDGDWTTNDFRFLSSTNSYQFGYVDVSGSGQLLALTTDGIFCYYVIPHQCEYSEPSWKTVQTKVMQRISSNADGKIVAGISTSGTVSLLKMHATGPGGTTRWCNAQRGPDGGWVDVTNLPSSMGTPTEVSLSGHHEIWITDSNNVLFHGWISESGGINVHSWLAFPGESLSVAGTMHGSFFSAAASGPGDIPMDAIYCPDRIQYDNDLRCVYLGGPKPTGSAASPA